MDPLAQFDQLGPVLGPIVLGIRPDQLDEPTPAGMTVRGVLEHMIGGGSAFAAAYRGEAPPETDFGEPVEGCARMLGELAEAIAAPGALDRTIAAPFGEVDGESFARFVVLDAAVMLEAGWNNVCDRVVYVDAPREIRVARLAARSGWSAADLAARETAQWPAERKKELADAVILNDAGVRELQEKVDQLLGSWGIPV